MKVDSQQHMRGDPTHQVGSFLDVGMARQLPPEVSPDIGSKIGLVVAKRDNEFRD